MAFIAGNAPSGAKDGIAPSGPPSVRLKCRPRSASGARARKARAASGQFACVVMAEVAVSRPAARASRMPRVTAGDKAKSSAQSANFGEEENFGEIARTLARLSDANLPLSCAFLRRGLDIPANVPLRSRAPGDEKDETSNG